VQHDRPASLGRQPENWRERGRVARGIPLAIRQQFPDAAGATLQRRRHGADSHLAGKGVGHGERDQARRVAGSSVQHVGIAGVAQPLVAKSKTESHRAGHAGVFHGSQQILRAGHPRPRIGVQQAKPGIPLAERCSRGQHLGREYVRVCVEDFHASIVAGAG